MLLKMTHNCKFCQKSGLDWVKMAIFAYFSIFSPKIEAEIDSEWSISPDSQLFPSFATKASHFWRNLKNFCFRGGGVHRQIFWVFQLFHIVSHQCCWKWSTMANLAKKWLRLGQNGHFCTFFYLFPQNEAEIDSEWSISPDSQLFPSFATKASHFWRNLKNFRFWGGGVHRQIFWVFQLFHIVSHKCCWKWPTIANLAKKVA